ncbi:MAG: hypothetical protein ACO1PB_01210 [Ramlibacter sp.]
MNKIILSVAAAAALASAGGAFAQSAHCRNGLPDATGACISNGRTQGHVPAARPGEEQTLMGLTWDGHRYSYREPDRGPYAYYGNDGRWFGDDRRNERRNDRDRDGIRDQRDYDRDGDGVRNSRDSHPDNPRRR